MIDVLAADMGALLDHLDTYYRVRGWRARRVHLTLHERMTLILSPEARAHIMSAQMHLMCEGAVILSVLNQDVANRIREWDLQP